MESYDLLVVGAGSGGLTAAEIAASFGVRVAVIERRDQLGGECLNTGCVPSKALISAARVLRQARVNSYGFRYSGPVDYTAVRRHIQQAIQSIVNQTDNEPYLARQGIEVKKGEASFENPYTLRVGSQRIRAKKIIIASGSSPLIPPIYGLQSEPFLTNESVFDLEDVPKQLLVVGGGPIGCELGQAFALLGSRVTILQSAERLLPNDEPFASAALLASFEKLGIAVALGAGAKQVERSDKGIKLTFEQNAKNKQVTGTHLLLATGRQPNVVPGSEQAGIAVDKRGYRVDRYLRSTQKHVYVIGDAAGGLQFTHYAGQQAAVAVRNALFPLFRKKQQFAAVPWATFTTPEIAHIGASMSSLQGSRQAFTMHDLPYERIDRAVSEAAQGQIRLYVDRKQRILGATVVGEQASELIGHLSYVQQQKGGLKDFAAPIYPYPTYNLALKGMAAEAIYAQNRRSRLLRWLTQR